MAMDDTTGETGAESSGGRIDPKRIGAVERLIRPHIRTTPVLTADLADFGLAAGSVHFKLEFLQHAGSFKTRGAFANLLSRKIPPAGVVAASGGNHGAAVAYAAHRLHIPAKVFVPSVAAPAKLERIRSLGADLTIVGDRYADALAASQIWATQSGALPVHAFDQAETMLGQGTIGLELEAQLPRIDTLLVAVGGGGLIGGIAAWYAGRIAVTGVEPESAPTLTYALREGRPVDAPAGGIAADSLAPKRIGEQVFPIARRHVRSVILVSDEAIRDAQRRLWDVLRLAIEPGGAAAAAAVLCGAYRPRPGEQLGIVLSGANTDAVAFAT
jgi:threonine dehydratase